MELSKSQEPLRPELEVAGSLQAVLNDLTRRDFSLDIQQQEALDAIGQALAEGIASGYIDMATSTGKTVVEALLAEAAVKAGKRVLMLAPTVPIARQIAGHNDEATTGLARFASLPADTTVKGRFGASQGKTSADIVVTTYTGFLNDTKVNHKNLGSFDIVIADECHRSLGEQTSKALKAAFPGAIKIGLSATPDYAVDRKSEEVYDNCLYDFSLLKAVEAGRTAPVRALLYETNEALNLIDNRKEFTDRELAPLIDNPERNSTALSLAKTFVKEGRQGVIACIPGQANLHARLMADLLKTRGIHATDIGSHLSAEDQALRLRLFSEGIFDVLTFTRALEEGWDSDKASFAINLSPTSSPVRTTQLLGRILRRKPDGTESIYVDFVDKKSGVFKSQYTAMHALDIDTIDFNRTLGHYETVPGGSFNKTLSLLHYINPELMARLVESQGKKLRDISVGNPVDPLVKEWEKRLAKAGMPAELDANSVLPPKLTRQLGRAYLQFYRDNEVAPTVDELLEKLTNVPAGTRAALASYAIRAELDPLEESDRLELPATDQLADNIYELAAAKALTEQLREVLDTLSEREAGIIEMRFGLRNGEPARLDDIGKAFGITRERVRQIESKAMSKLRHPLRSQFLRDYAMDTSRDDSGQPLAEKTGVRPKIDSTNPYVKQFGKFQVVASPEPLNLEKVTMSKEQAARHLYSDDTGKHPFNWVWVREARRRLGILHPDRAEFHEKRQLIGEAVQTFENALKRLNDLPLVDSESSLNQRLATISVYESRVRFLKVTRDQLDQLEAFLNANGGFVPQPEL